MAALIWVSNGITSTLHYILRGGGKTLLWLEPLWGTEPWSFHFPTNSYCERWYETCFQECPHIHNFEESQCLQLQIFIAGGWWICSTLVKENALLTGKQSITFDIKFWAGPFRKLIKTSDVQLAALSWTWAGYLWKYVCLSCFPCLVLAPLKHNFCCGSPVLPQYFAFMLLENTVQISTDIRKGERPGASLFYLWIQLENCDMLPWESRQNFRSSRDEKAIEMDSDHGAWRMFGGIPLSIDIFIVNFFNRSGSSVVTVLGCWC